MNAFALLQKALLALKQEIAQDVFDMVMSELEQQNDDFPSRPRQPRRSTLMQERIEIYNERQKQRKERSNEHTGTK